METLKAFVGSTSRDLPEHRAQAKDACLRAGILPIMMEHWPASSMDPAAYCTEQVRRADLYVGIVGRRYGYIPPGHRISITELEYRTAVHLGLRCFLFLSSDDHPASTDEEALPEQIQKLRDFRAELLLKHTVNFFQSAEDLRSQLLTTLFALNDRNQVSTDRPTLLPVPPSRYVAFSYDLMVTKNLIGREGESERLRAWLSDAATPRVLSICALGGTGKSALAWEWFQSLPESRPTIWWSFYGFGADFESCIRHCLAYLTRQSLNPIRSLPVHECTQALIAAIHDNEAVLVFDGIERLLLAYSQMSGPALADDLRPERSRRRRQTSQPEAGRFLKSLAALARGRIVLTSRLHPAALEDEASGLPLRGVEVWHLEGLNRRNAVRFTQALGVTGLQAYLEELALATGCHPLALQAFAGEVRKDRQHRGNLDSWLKSHPERYSLPGSAAEIVDRILRDALGALSPPVRRILAVVSACRMPLTFQSLVGLSGETAAEIDGYLTELENRGLIGWNQSEAACDLHPVVRGAVWNLADSGEKKMVFERLRDHFRAGGLADPRTVETLAELGPAVELFNALAGLGQYDDALEVFRNTIADGTLDHLSYAREHCSLIRLLFREGPDQAPPLTGVERQIYATRELARGYRWMGQPGLGTALLGRLIEQWEGQIDLELTTLILSSFAGSALNSGQLMKAELAVRRGVLMSRTAGIEKGEFECLPNLGLVLATRGSYAAASRVLLRYEDLAVRFAEPVEQVIARCFLSKLAGLQADHERAFRLANDAFSLAAQIRNKRQQLHSANRQASALAGLRNLTLASERYQWLIAEARRVELIEEEVEALIGLGFVEIERSQENVPEYLNEARDLASSGPYVGFQSQVYLLEAKLAAARGRREEAALGARRSFESAWADGPPFVYRQALTAAQDFIEGLGAEIPVLRSDAAGITLPEIAEDG